MPCGCNCSKMKRKFLSIFHRPCSFKQEETDVQTEKQETERKNYESEMKEKDENFPDHINGSQISEKEDSFLKNCKTQTLQEACFLRVCEEYGAEENGETDEQIDGKNGSLPFSGSRRKMSTHFDKLRSLLKADYRRDAICDEMEKKIQQAEGVSLRQYRKFLATSSVLQELKML